MAQGGRCFLIFHGVVDGKMGAHMLDRKKTPSHYGMTYDETVHLVVSYAIALYTCMFKVTILIIAIDCD